MSIFVIVLFGSSGLGDVVGIDKNTTIGAFEEQGFQVGGGKNADYESTRLI